MKISSVNLAKIFSDQELINADKKETAQRNHLALNNMYEESPEIDRILKVMRKDSHERDFILREVAIKLNEHLKDSTKLDSFV